ncbi:hypothetical protein CSUB01_10479 [Colletotrichum sublineola]|uniref:Uncharacterized protein n=1 Tax=Colletotrichum sublineola TaxID=1173701 RepID=A0A066XS76_COLSU|nr:hypothetical protein CSUB01_10479 [Colletotrichum sublineola]
MDFDPALPRRPATAHPHDAFSAVRFSLRIPSPSGIFPCWARTSSTSPASPSSIAESSSPIASPPRSRGPSPNRRRSRSRSTSPSLDSQLQSFELCFHAGFIADPSKPISLHFDSSLSTYSTPLILPCPMAPYYVHEITHVLDLVNPSDSQVPVPPSPLPLLPPPPSPPPSPGQDRPSRTHPFATLAAAITVAVAAIVIALIGGALLNGLFVYKPQQQQAGAWPITTIHNESSSLIHLDTKTPSGAFYSLRLETRPSSLDVYGRFLPIQQLRLSLIPHLLNTLEALPDVLFALHPTITDMCQSIELLRITTKTLVNNHTDPDVERRICEHMRKRVQHATAIWHELMPASDAQSAIWAMVRAVKMLALVTNETLITAAYRKSQLFETPPVWVDACKLCERDNNDDKALSPTPPPGLPMRPFHVADWHFACDLGLPGAYTSGSDNSSAAVVLQLLRSWAEKQDARRVTDLRDAPRDVDDEPIYLNNQHPFDEADEMVFSSLPVEGNILALTRHLVELEKAMVDVTHSVVAEFPDILHAPPQAADQQGRNDDHGGTWLDKLLPRRRGQADSASGKGSPANVLLAAKAREHAKLLGANKAQLDRLRAQLEPIVGVLGQTSAGMALACQLAASADMQGFLDGIDEGKYPNSSTVVIAQISDLPPPPPPPPLRSRSRGGSRSGDETADQPTTTIISVVRARPTLNVAAEVDALEKHVAQVWDPINEARRHMTRRPRVVRPWEQDSISISDGDGDGCLDS